MSNLPPKVPTAAYNRNSTTMMTALPILPGTLPVADTPAPVAAGGASNVAAEFLALITAHVGASGQDPLGAPSATSKASAIPTPTDEVPENGAEVPASPAPAAPPIQKAGKITAEKPTIPDAAVDLLPTNADDAALPTPPLPDKSASSAEAVAKAIVPKAPGETDNSAAPSKKGDEADVPPVAVGAPDAVAPPSPPVAAPFATTVPPSKEREHAPALEDGITEIPAENLTAENGTAKVPASPAFADAARERTGNAHSPALPDGIDDLVQAGRQDGDGRLQANPASVIGGAERSVSGPASSSEPAPISVHSGSFGKELGIAIARHATQPPDVRSEALTVRLDPPEHGRIEVRLVFEDGTPLRAHVIASNPGTLDMLRRESPELIRAMGQAGIGADAQSFQFDSRTGNQQQQGSQQPAYPQDEFLPGITDLLPVMPTEMEYRSLKSGTINLIA